MPMPEKAAETTRSWRGLAAAQQPSWPDQAGLRSAAARLATYPPLVFAGECDLLKERIASVVAGHAFILQGGDCAETFQSVTADDIRDKLKTLLQMAAVLSYAASLPVVKIGRLAGQYAKPRTSDTETRDGVTLPAYRGDAVNGLDFTQESRTPDPQRLLEVYRASAATLNLVRAFVTGGYADLRQVHMWNQDFVANSPGGRRYEMVANEIDRALRFMHACGADPKEFKTVEFFASHEALILDYEDALTRVDSRTGKLYGTSGHLLWIGERTRAMDGAHLEYARTIANPIAVKLGPKTTREDIGSLTEMLNPKREPGRLTFVARMGAGLVRDVLPALVQEAARIESPVAWVCDPMHGNTFEAANGYKTRRFDDVLDETRGFFEVHADLGTHPGGVHIELTGDDVTECVGGADEVFMDDLHHRYETACDPRLNRAQSLELAFLMAESYRGR